MQTREQWNQGRNWKVVTAVGTLSALGISGLALAGPGSSAEPQAITLKDAQPVTTVTASVTSVPTTLQEANDQVADSVVTGQESPASPLSVQSTETSQTVQSAQSAESTQTFQEPAPTVESVDEASAQSDEAAPVVESAASGDSGSADS